MTEADAPEGPAAREDAPAAAADPVAAPAAEDDSLIQRLARSIRDPEDWEEEVRLAVETRADFDWAGMLASQRLLAQDQEELVETFAENLSQNGAEVARFADLAAYFMRRCTAPGADETLVKHAEDAWEGVEAAQDHVRRSWTGMLKARSDLAALRLGARYCEAVIERLEARARQQTEVDLEGAAGGTANADGPAD